MSFTGLSLVLSGCFALFLSATGHFLPHDVEYLGMTPEQLCAIHECRIVHFMIHDRVSFGGALFAIGLLYLWMAEFPLRIGEAWAWWAFLLSGILGFGSFLAYLGYGYLDTWHGVATLVLLPCTIAGLARSWFHLQRPAGIGSLLRPSVAVPWRTSFGVGRACLLATAAGLVLGGSTIMALGMTSVFVPQDLKFLRLDPAELFAVNPRLVPLIAHDRAGFGGGVATCGVTMLFCLWCGAPCRSLWQATCLAGGVGFAAAIGVHPIIGYNDLVHLAPAVLGAGLFLTGLLLTWKPMLKGMEQRPGPPRPGGGERVSQSAAERIIELFESRGDAEYHGEPVSQKEHALQAAHFAEEEGASGALVVAALLHDLGHLLHGRGEDIAERGVDARHEEAGQAWLAEHFGPEVTEPIRLHVAAKRYLCAVDPAYRARLSPASVRSLALQGGPLGDAEVAEFRRNPHHREAVRLRLWDDRAKVVGLAVPGLEHYRPRLEALARR